MRFAALLIAVGALGVASTQALTSAQVQEIKQTVLSVPVPEMPAKAAELVAQAGQKDKQPTAMTAIRAVVAKHPAAAPLMISAISKVAPEIAPAIAAATSELSQDQAPLIARAAAVAAPGQAGAVSTAVSLAVPARASIVANSVNSASSVARPAAPVSAAATRPAVGARGSALIGNSSGVIIISDTPIAGGQFPAQPPAAAPAPIVVYSQPPQ